MRTVLADTTFLEGLGAPQAEGAWEFSLRDDVQKLDACPPGLTCRQGGGELFSAAWLEAVNPKSAGNEAEQSIEEDRNPAVGEESQIGRGEEASPLVDSVEFTPSAPVYWTRQSESGEETRLLGFCGFAEGAARTLLALPDPFGLPQQSLEAWNDTLDKALELAPQHLSLYSLIVEPGTPLAHWVETGQTPPPDDDQAAALYETAMARLGKAGYLHYEVSNWARGKEFACRHNLIYWRNQDWIGVGPGAHSHLRYPLSRRLRRQLTGGGFDEALPEPNMSMQCGQAALRWSNHKSVKGYMKRVDSGETPVDFCEELQALVSMGETMMLGLRLVQEGVTFARFEALHGQPMHAVFGPKLERLQDAGMRDSNQERVRLTARGLMLGNRGFSEFVV